MPRIRGHSAVKDPSEERANQHTQRNGKGRLQPFPFLAAGWMTGVKHQSSTPIPGCAFSAINRSVV
jgi:hypothetical protein